MKWLRLIFSKGIPAYFWLGLFYAGFVGVYALLLPSAGAAADGAEAIPLSARIEILLTDSLFAIPLFSGTSFEVTWTVIFITFGFVCAWIEVVRATMIRDTAQNDTWSLIVTLLAFVLFVGVEAFGTTAFLVVALVGFGDVLLDRFVGQAVARRDFGGLFGGGGG